MTNKKITVSSVIFGLIVLLFIALIIYPLVNGIKKESEDFISQKRALAELDAKTRNLKDFQTTYQTYQPNLEKIDDLFIDPTEPLSFIEFLEKEAVVSQLLIEISPLSAKETKEDTWPSLSFRLTLTGPFPNFLRFLEKLESSSYLINISNLNLRRITEERPGDIDTSFSIKVYTK